MKDEYKVSELNTSGSSNKFRFLGFNERIANIDVDVFHRILPVVSLQPSLPFLSSDADSLSSTLLESPTWFRSALFKWHHNDLTAHFDAFFTQLEPLCRTLPELLHHRRRVIATLLEHLKVPDSRAVQAILDIIASLARDLRKYTHEFFPELISSLVGILDVRDPHRLEWIFSCIGFLFKYLDKELLPQLDQVFSRYTNPLLLHPKQYIRDFAAESFSFLLRKLNPSSKSFRKLLFRTILPEQPPATHLSAAVSGYATLLFFAMKGVSGHFHSKMVPIFTLCLQHCQAPSYRVQVIKQVLQLMADHCRGSDPGAQDVILAFQEYFGLHSTNPSSSSSSSSSSFSSSSSYSSSSSTTLPKSKSKTTSSTPSSSLSHSDEVVIDLLRAWTRCQRGERVKQCFQPLFSLAQHLLTHYVASLSLPFLAVLVRSACHQDFSPSALSSELLPLLPAAFDDAVALDLLLDDAFLGTLITPQLTPLPLQVAKLFHTFTTRRFRRFLDALPPPSSALQRLPAGAQLLAQFVADHAPFQGPKWQLDAKQDGGLAAWELITFCFQLLQHDPLAIFQEHPTLVTFLKFLCNLSSPAASVLPFLDDLSAFLAQKLTDDNAFLPALRAQILRVSISVTSHPPYLHAALRLLRSAPTSPECLDLALDVAQASPLTLAVFQALPEPDLIRQIFAALLPVLHHPQSHFRLTALRIIYSLALPLSFHPRHLKLIAGCIEIESSPRDALHGGKLIATLLSFAPLLTSECLLPDSGAEQSPLVPSQFPAHLLLNYLLGATYIHFSPLKASLLQTFQILSNVLPLQLFWSIFLPFLQQVEKDATTTNSVARRQLADEVALSSPSIDQTTSSARGPKRNRDQVIEAIMSREKRARSLQDHDQRRIQLEDAHRLHEMLWQILQGCSKIVSNYSSVLMDFFVDYLREEYHVLFASNISDESFQPEMMNEEEEDEYEEDHAKNHHNSKLHDDGDDDQTGDHLNEDQDNDNEEEEEEEEEEGNTHQNEKVDNEDEDVENVDNDQSSSESHLAGPVKGYQGSRKLATKRITNYLQFFVNAFKSNETLGQLQRIRDDLLNTFLLKADHQQQILALKLYSLLEPNIQSYLDHLERLADPRTLQHQVNLFKISAECETSALLGSSEVKGQLGYLAPHHRPAVLPVLIRIIYSKLFSRRGISRKGASGLRAASAHRGVLLSYLAGLSSSELSIFVRLLQRQFRDPQSSKLKSLDEVHFTIQVGYLNLLTDVVKQLGGLLISYLLEFFEIVFEIFSYVSSRLKAAAASGQAAPQRFLLIQLLSIQRIRALFSSYTLADLIPAPFMHSLIELLQPILAMTRFLSSKRTTAAIALLATLTTDGHFDLYDLFVTHSPQCVPTIVEALSFHQVHPLDSLSHKALVRLVDSWFDYDSQQLTQSPSSQHTLVRSHSSLILHHIQTCLFGVDLSESDSSVPISPSDSFPAYVLDLITKIALCTRDTSQAQKLLNILVCYFHAKEIPVASKCNIIDVSTKLLQLVDCEESRMKWLKATSPLFLRPSLYSSIHPLLRRALMNFASSLVLNTSFDFLDHNLFLSEFITVLFTRTSFHEDDSLHGSSHSPKLDQITRLADPQTILLLSADQWVPILYLTLEMLTSPDLSLRSMAAHLLQLFISIQSSPSPASSPSSSSLSLKDQHLEDNSETKLPMNATEHLHLISTILLPVARQGINYLEFSYRKECALLMAHLAVSWPDLLQPLTFFLKHPPAPKNALPPPPTLNKSMFESLLSIKPKLRVEALGKIAKKIDTAPVPEEFLCTFIVPLISPFLLHPATALPEARDRGIAPKSADRRSEIDAAILVLKAVARRCSWPRFSRLLSKFLKKLLDLKPKYQMPQSQHRASYVDLTEKSLTDAKANYLKEFERVLVQVLVGLLEEFHFEMTSFIENHIIDRILPSLSEHVHPSKSATDELRLGVVSLLTRFFKLLPDRITHSSLPPLMAKICQTLKSREEASREHARTGLIGIVDSLGPQYFKYILFELKTSFTRGYQLQILGYTVHHLLQHMTSKKLVQVGQLDHCLPLLVDLVFQDLFGEAGESKEIADFAKQWIEAQSNRVYASTQLIGSILSFPDSIQVVLQPISNHLEGPCTTKRINAIRRLLQFLGTGLLVNPSVTPPSMLIFLYRLLENDLPHLETKSMSANQTPISSSSSSSSGHSKFLKPIMTAFDSIRILPEPRHMTERKSAKNSTVNNHYVLPELALNHLLALLKRQVLSRSSLEHRQMLDPFVPLVLACLHSRFDKIVFAALPLLKLLLQYDLPSMNQSAGAMLSQVLNLLNKATAHSVMQAACFRCLSRLLQGYSQVTLSKAQLKLVLNFATPEIDKTTHQSATFALLKAIIHRKLLTPAIYDLSKRASDLLVRAEDVGVRTHCRSLIIDFLTKYPLSPERLRQEIDVHIRNLAYAYAAGRESVLELVHSFILSFPQEILLQYAEYFFVSLVLRLTNDSAETCREMAYRIIQSLLTSTLQAKVDRFLLLTQRWMADSNKAPVQLAAIQLVPLYVDIFAQQHHGTLKKFFIQVLPELVNLLSAHSLFKKSEENNGLQKSGPHDFENETEESSDDEEIESDEYEETDKVAEVDHDSELIDDDSEHDDDQDNEEEEEKEEEEEEEEEDDDEDEKVDFIYNLNDEDELSTIENSFGNWKLSHRLLVAIEKILQQISFSDDALKAQFWQEVVATTQHAHPWLKASSLRLLVFHMSSYLSLDQDIPEDDPILSSEDQSYRLFSQLATILFPSLFPQDLADRLLECLILLVAILIRNPHLRYRTPHEASHDAPPKDLIVSMFWRFSKMIRRERNGSPAILIRKKNLILRWMKESFVLLSPEDRSKVLQPLLIPVYPIVDSREKIMLPLQEDAHSLLETAQSLIDPAEFAVVYTQVKESYLEKRRQRAEYKRLLPVTRPDIVARRRTKMYARKAQRRRAKFDHLRQNRPTIKTKEFIPGQREYGDISIQKSRSRKK